MESTLLQYFFAEASVFLAFEALRIQVSVRDASRFIDVQHMFLSVGVSKNLIFCIAKE